MSNAKKAKSPGKHGPEDVGFFETVLAHSFDGVVVADRKGNILYTNPAMVRLFGYEIDKIPTVEEWCRRAALDPRQALALWKQDLESKTPPEREFPVVTEKGDECWCRFRMSFMENGNIVLNIQDITHHKDLEERYRTIFEQAEDAILLRDAETGKLLDFNRKAHEMLGYTREEFATLNIADIREDITPAEAKKHIDAILEAGTDVFDARYRKKNGDILNVRANCRVLHLGNKRILQTVVRDITEHLHASRALLESERRFQTIIDQSPVSMAIVGLDGTIEYINRKAVVTFGYAHKDIPTMERWWVQAYPDKTYRDQVVATWTGLVEKALAENHEIEGREYRVTCKDGTVKIMLIFGVPIAGKVFVMFEDITARKDAEETFRNLAEQSPNMIFINQGGRIVYANTRCEEIMGYSRQELCSPDFSFMKLVAPEYQVLTGQYFQKHAEGGEVPAYEYVVVTKSGSRIPAVVSTKLIQYERRPAILGIVTDLSDLKYAEASLRESAARLRQQKKALEEKNAALKEVLAQIETEKMEIRRQITTNVEKLVLPILHKLTRKATPSDRRHLAVLESNLQDLTSKFGTRISGGTTALSARETEICAMIKSGLSSKEIADTLRVSLRTVDTYRNRIRKKFGISNRHINLFTHIQSLT